MHQQQPQLQRSPQRRPAIRTVTTRPLATQTNRRSQVAADADAAHRMNRVRHASDRSISNQQSHPLPSYMTTTSTSMARSRSRSNEHSAHPPHTLSTNTSITSINKEHPLQSHTQPTTVARRSTRPTINSTTTTTTIPHTQRPSPTTILSHQPHNDRMNQEEKTDTTILLPSRPFMHSTDITLMEDETDDQATSLVVDTATNPAQTSFDSLHPVLPSSSNSISISGFARIVDLHPDEKSKIGKLLQEIVHLKKETIQRESNKERLEQTLSELQEESQQRAAEAQRLKEEYEQSQLLLKEYQQQLEQSKEQSIQSSPKRMRSDNPNLSRLYDLNERARIAAAATSPSNPTLRPFTTVLNSLTSSPYQPQITSLNATTIQRPLSSTGSYSTEDEVPRSRIPMPSPGTQPLTSSNIQTQLPPQTTLHEIERAYHETLSEASHQQSLSPRHSLNLESGTTTAFSSLNQSPESSRRSSFNVSSASMIHPVPPPPTTQPMVRTSNGIAPLPSNITMLPTAISGVTRALVSSSPEQIERRAMELAQRMYEQKIQEEEAKKMKESQQRVSHVTFTATSSQPLPSSLRSFMQSHPLTSQLTPLKSQPSRHQRADRTKVKQDDQRESSDSDEQKAPDDNQSHHHSNPSTIPTGLSNSSRPSHTASDLLNKSVQIANSYAEERRARSTSASTRPSTTSHLNASHRPTIDLPDSPFTSTMFAMTDPTSMTPTTRKIHRLLSIQQPQLIEAAKQKKAQEQIAAASRMKEELERQQILTQRRKQDLERRTKQAEAEAEQQQQSKAAIQPPEVQQPQEEMNLNIIHHIPSQPLLKPPPSTTLNSRSVTPVDSYVPPPPFSYRTKSRASAASTDMNQSNPTNSTNLPRSTEEKLNTSQISSVLSTPMPPISRTERPVPHTHTSFLSPSSVTSGHPASLSPDSSPEDTEVDELFHLRSPASLQHAVEDEVVQELLVREREARRQKHSQPYTTNGPTLQETLAHNFAQDMLAASTTTTTPSDTNHTDRPSYVGIPTQPFQYSSPYPITRPTHSHPPPVESIPSDQDAADASRLARKMKELRELQLERELEEVMPQIFQQLQTQTKPITPMQPTIHTSNQQNETKENASSKQPPLTIPPVISTGIPTTPSRYAVHRERNRDRPAIDHLTRYTATNTSSMPSTTAAAQPTSTIQAVQAVTGGSHPQVIDRKSVLSRSLLVGEFEVGDCLELIDQMEGFEA